MKAFHKEGVYDFMLPREDIINLHSSSLETDLLDLDTRKTTGKKQN